MQCMAHAPRPHLFLFPAHPRGGQQCLALFSRLGDQYLVLVGDQASVLSRQLT